MNNPSLQWTEEYAKLEVELKAAQEDLSAIRYSIVATVGGTDYEGLPTSELNWLQRLRILVEKEEKLWAAEAQVEHLDKLRAEHLRRILILEDHVTAQNRRMNADRDKEALAYSSRISELEAQLAEAKLPESVAASKSTYAYQLQVLEQRLARYREALDRNRREFLSMKQALQRGVLPHDLSDQVIRCHSDTQETLREEKV